MNDRPSRKQLRAPSWNYAEPASYMVTICVHDRLQLLAHIVQDTSRLTDAGRMVQSTWQEIPSRFPTTTLDAFVVMPNHLHGILHLHHDLVAEGPYPLGDVLRWFKGASSRHYALGVTDHGWPRFRDRFWHRNYYETIIRSEPMLDRLRRYIENNPANWPYDPESSGP